MTVHKSPIDHSYRLLFRTPRLQLLRRPGPPYPPCLLPTQHPSPRLSETTTTWAIQHLPSPTPPTQPWLPLSPMPAICPILATFLTEVHLMGLMEAMAIPAMVTFIPASDMATHPKVQYVYIFTKPNLHSINSSKTLSSLVCSFLFLLRLAD
jgi:hypothetical protein